MIIDGYDEEILECIREVCQELFHNNYINEYVFSTNDALKKANDDYTFMMRHFDAIEELLNRCGWHLCHDRSVGVLYLRTDFGQAKVLLKKMESYFLLAVRILYDERKPKATAVGEVYVTVREVVEQLVTLGAVETVTKEERKSSLRALIDRNIVALTRGSLSELDTIIAILPSVVCALSAEKMKAVVKSLENENSIDNMEDIYEDVDESVDESVDDNEIEHTEDSEEYI